MTISIVACGLSAKEWASVPCDRSIGVNDAWKWGAATTDLLVCNWPSKFPTQRLNIIKDSKPQQFWSSIEQWRVYFPAMIKIRLNSWDGHLYKIRHDEFSSLHTSPFIAMSMAYKFGATNIILWGVEFINHSTYDRNNPQTRSEVRAYQDMCEALSKEGVKVWLGKETSALNLPVWPAK